MLKHDDIDEVVYHEKWRWSMAERISIKELNKCILKESIYIYIQLK